MSQRTQEAKTPIKLAVITAVDITMSGLVLAQLKAARDRGYEVHGVCTEGSNFPSLREEGIQMHGVTIYRKMSPFRDLKTLWKLYSLFRCERFSVVHTHTPKVSLLGQLAAKLAGVPVIINTVHGYYFHENMKPLPRLFYTAMEWIASRCSTFILSQNPEDVETAIRLRIAHPGKIQVLGNGVDLNHFDPLRFSEADRVRKRQTIGIPPNAVVVGIIGRLVREKGYLELFQAMKQLMDHHENAWLMIIGIEEPEKADRISGHTFKEYGIEERTKWMGECRKEEIPGLLACCDIYVLPSWREGFPRSAIEAAAMGLPVVATNIRGCRQVVEHETSGLLVPLKDVKALTQALCRLLESQDLRQRMGQAGYEKSRKEFDEGRICEIVVETYDRLALRAVCKK